MKRKRSSGGLERKVPNLEAASSSLAASTTAYYNSLAAEQMQEESDWGEIGLDGLLASLEEEDGLA